MSLKLDMSKAYDRMSLKLDMSKAYDRVEWMLLDEMMKRIGFGKRWRRVVMDCISTPRFPFLINGTIQGKVIPQRDLRQGCPLSPYLFLICAEGLSSLISQSERDGQLMDFACNRWGPRISHLLFADDSLLFGRADKSEAEVKKNVLDVYSRQSGQDVNFNKTSIVFSSKVVAARREEIHVMLGERNRRPK